MRERFLSAGLEGFRDYEVLELLLTLATPRKDCKQPAKEVLKKFKSLPAVFDAADEELCTVAGIGPKNLFGIRLVKAVAERYHEGRMAAADPLQNSGELYAYLQHSMSGRDRECFKVLYLDAKNRVLGVEDLFEGTLTASSVYPREVVKNALNRKAAAVIFAHNHPSGDPEPSPADFAVTRQLMYACMVTGITVHEHLVIGKQNYFSFADSGHISRISREFSEDMEKWRPRNG